MEKNFKINNQLEEIIEIIERDSSALDGLGIEELEMVQKYLEQKKEFLLKDMGDK